MMNVFVLILCLSLVASVQSAPGCKPYVNTLPSGSLGFCTGVFPEGYEYYTQDTAISQEAMEVGAVQSLTGGQSLVEKLLILLPESCGVAMKTAACLATFPKCEKIDPYFLNPCHPVLETCNEATARCRQGATDNEKLCAPLPGTIPGVAPRTEWTQESCGVAGLIWDVTTSKCLRPIPKFPCKSQCDEITNMNKTVNALGQFTAKCPLLSGHFFTRLIELANSDDPYIADQVVKTLQEKDCAAPATSAEQQACGNKLYTVNLLTLLDFAPNCTQRADTFKVFPEGPQDVTVFVQAAINQLGNLATPQDCGGAGIPCDQVLATVATCATAEANAPGRSVQQGYGTIKADSNNICKDVIRDLYTNQDQELISLLSKGLAAVQQPDNTQQCMSSLLEEYRGLHFVSSYPGLGPLSPKVEMSTKSENPFGNAACPRDTPTKFTNIGVPLCTNPVTGQSFYNSKECLDDKIQSTWNAFPPFAPYKCRLAFQELLCTQGYTKVNLNQLCMVPNDERTQPNCALSNQNGWADAAAQDRVPFLFPIPRFPSKRMCNKYREECAAIIEPGSPLDMDCDGPINIDTCASSELQGKTWGCNNPLNGLPQYPDSRLTLADISAIPLVAQYGAAFGLSVYLAEAFQSVVVEPTISKKLYQTETDEILEEIQGEYCECPYPLEAPNDPRGETLSPATCCALPCLGSMNDEEDINRFGLMQLILSALGVACAIFMCVTWYIFPEKHKQYMTFWLSFCSFNVSLAFLLAAAVPGGDVKETLCKDNTTPVLMEDGFSLCSMQGLWLMYFALAECGWWCCQSFDLFRKLVLGKRNTDDTRLKYHLFSWGPPTIGAIVLLVTQSFGYTRNNVYCLMDDNSDSLLEWLCFYVPVGLLFIAGTVMMFSVLAIIIRHTNRSGKLNQGTSSSGKFRVRYKMYRTPMLFVMMFIFVWLNIFAFRLLVLINTSTYEDQAKAWIGCLTTNYWKNNITDPARDPRADTSMLIGDFQYDAVGCGTKQPGGVPRGSLTLTFIVVMAQSILIFMVFGVQADNYRLWGEKFGCVDPVERTHMTNDTFTNSKDDSKFGNAMGNSYYNSYDQPGPGMGGSMGGGNMMAAPPGTSFYSIRKPDGMPPRPPPGLPPAPNMGGNNYGSYY